MKKRIILSLLLVPILLITLGLTGCAKTSGEGVFLWVEDGDGGSPDIDHNISFEVQAEPAGKAYKNSIGEDDSMGIDFQYVHFQPATGKIEFLDTFNNFKIECDVEGTLYVKPQQYELAFGDSYLPEDYLYSLYVGPSEAKQGDGKGECYLLAIFGDYIGEETDNPDMAGFLVFEEDIFEDGVIDLSASPLMECIGGVVEGDLNIE